MNRRAVDLRSARQLDESGYFWTNRRGGKVQGRRGRRDERVTTGGLHGGGPMLRWAAVAARQSGRPLQRRRGYAPRFTIKKTGPEHLAMPGPMVNQRSEARSIKPRAWHADGAARSSQALRQPARGRFRPWRGRSRARGPESRSGWMIFQSAESQPTSRSL